MARFKSIRRFEKRVGTKVTSGVNPGGGEWESRSAVYEPVIVDVELLIDADALMQRLGARALKSKSGKATALHGLIKVKVTGERKA